MDQLEVIHEHPALFVKIQHSWYQGPGEDIERMRDKRIRKRRHRQKRRRKRSRSQGESKGMICPAAPLLA
jgi:hypothetical protein